MCSFDLIKYLVKKTILLLIVFGVMNAPNAAHALSTRSLAEIDPFWCELGGGTFLEGLGGTFCLYPWESD